MDKWQALQTFWSSFGITAYDENTVPDNAPYPHITYNASTAELDEAVYLSASLWYRSNSWAGISPKAEQIAEYIGGGAGVKYDSGRLWITKGVPFAQRMPEESDLQVRRMVLQVNAEFQ